MSIIIPFWGEFDGRSDCKVIEDLLDQRRSAPVTGRLFVGRNQLAVKDRSGPAACGTLVQGCNLAI